MAQFQINNTNLNSFCIKCDEFVSNLSKRTIVEFKPFIYDVLSRYIGMTWVGNYELENNLIEEFPQFARFVLLPCMNDILTVDWSKGGIVNIDKPNTKTESGSGTNFAMVENSPLNADDEITSPSGKTSNNSTVSNTVTYSGDMVNLQWVQYSREQKYVLQKISNQFKKLVLEYLEVL